MGETFANRYRLDSSLGETSEYHNFSALDLASNSQRVSLKVFYPRGTAAAGDFERIRRDFARLRATPAHPHLVRLLDFGRWRGVVYLAAEWIEGHPLIDLLRRRGALSVPEAVRVARQAAAATDHARTHGLPALDLEPRAILLAFAEPLPFPAWEQLLGTPVERWPVFTLKITPRPFAPGSLPKPTLWVLGSLVYELLGHPPSRPGGVRRARIAGLGEAGNAILTRGVASAGQDFGGDAGFVEALGQAAGMTALSGPAMSDSSQV